MERTRCLGFSRGRCVRVSAAVLVVTSGCLLGLGGSADAARFPRTQGVHSLGAGSDDSASGPHFYVAAKGSANGPCTIAKPCSSVGRAVAMANHVPYAFEPVTISIGEGTFVTHLEFPDGPYPEKSLTIIGASRTSTKLSGAQAGPVLIAYADAPPITVDNVTISQGNGTEGVGGGAIHNGGNVMTFNNVMFAHNRDSTSPADGGAVDDDGGAVTVNGSTFEDNTAGSGAQVGTGGAIGVDGGSLAVNGSLVLSNSVPVGGSGGGIGSSFGNVTLSHSTVKGNAAGASGGGIWIDWGNTTSGNVTLDDSTVTGNTAGGSGGGIWVDWGNVTITGSTVTTNTAGGSGGGIFARSGKATITDSTVAENTAVGSGGALYFGDVGRPYIIGSTFNGNSAGGRGGLVDLNVGTVRVGGSILIGNSGAGGSTCAGGEIQDLGYNVIDITSCPLGPKSWVRTAAAVELLRQAQNGGATETERIPKKSAAFDVVPGTAGFAGSRFCGSADQRSVPRQQGPAPRCDAGAYQYAPPVITGVSPKKAAPGTPITISGYGFDFVSLRLRGSTQALTAHTETKISFIVPDMSQGRALIELANADGRSTASFDILPKSKHPGS